MGTLLVRHGCGLCINCPRRVHIYTGNVPKFKSYHIGIAAVFVGIGEMVGEFTPQELLMHNFNSQCQLIIDHMPSPHQVFSLYDN